MGSGRASGSTVAFSQSNGIVWLICLRERVIRFLGSSRVPPAGRRLAASCLECRGVVTGGGAHLSQRGEPLNWTLDAFDGEHHRLQEKHGRKVFIICVQWLQGAVQTIR